MDRTGTMLTLLATVLLMVVAACTPREETYDRTIMRAERMTDTQVDLLQKATGWILREVGKKDEAALCSFLDCHAATMPRTMLRYAVERFSPERRKHYLLLRTTRQ